jgi:hypothetical protein
VERAVVTGAVGYAIACLLAKATVFAEEVEEQEFCRDAPVGGGPCRT